MEGHAGCSQNIDTVGVGREDEAVIYMDVGFHVSENTVLFQTNASQKLRPGSGVQG